LSRGLESLGIACYSLANELNLGIKLNGMNTQTLLLFIIKNVVPVLLLLIVFFKVILPVLTILAHILRLLLTLFRDLIALIVKYIQKKKNAVAENGGNGTVESQAKFFGYE
jgi:hypothetical protein